MTVSFPDDVYRYYSANKLIYNSGSIFTKNSDQNCLNDVRVVT